MSRRPSDDEEWEDAAQPPPKLFIKSSKEFVAGFVPPEYVVVGLLQRRFFYSLTGQTGAGKTAIMLLLSASAALGRPFAGRETKPVRVLYLAAENADDVRMRWIAFAQNMDFDIDTIEVYFVEGRFSLSKSLQLLRAEAERHGGEFGIVIVDTGPTFFEGKDENENKQLGDHARMLRSLIDTIPGGPCVVANCHPTKNAQPRPADPPRRWCIPCRSGRQPDRRENRFNGRTALAREISRARFRAHVIPHPHRDTPGFKGRRRPINPHGDRRTHQRPGQGGYRRCRA